MKNFLKVVLALFILMIVRGILMYEPVQIFLEVAISVAITFWIAEIFKNRCTVKKETLNHDQSD